MFESEVEELSLNHVDIVQDVLVYDKPINHLDDDNSITPESFDDDTRERFKDYNSVYSLNPITMSTMQLQSIVQFLFQ